MANPLVLSFCPCLHSLTRSSLPRREELSSEEGDQGKETRTIHPNGQQGLAQPNQTSSWAQSPEDLPLTGLGLYLNLT